MRDIAKEFKPSKDANDGKNVNQIAVFLNIKKKVDKKFKWTYLPCIKLPQFQIKEIQDTYSRLGSEILTIMSIPYYLLQELDKKEPDAYMCYYHIDNFYHRIYVIEQMISRLIIKLFMGGKGGDTDTIRNQLDSYGYKDVAKFLKKFANDTRKIRDRRRRLVHRTGSSAEEIIDRLALAQFTNINGPVKQILAPHQIGQKYCNTELGKIRKISSDYLTHVGNFLLLIDNNTL